MRRKAKQRNAKPHGGNVLLVMGLALILFLLLLRMIAFVAGHGRHHY